LVNHRKATLQTGMLAWKILLLARNWRFRLWEVDGFSKANSNQHP
jgi:hypothetical protein